MNNHVCLHYKTKEDLIAPVAHFFEQGFNANALCIWVVPRALGISGAKTALSKKIEYLNLYMKKGWLELLNYKDAYLRSGVFNPDSAMKFWAEKERDALRRGFSGLYVSGDAAWLRKKDWNKMVAYEEAVNKALPEKNIKALCTYPAERFNFNKMFNLSLSHERIIRREDGKIEVLICA